MRNPQIFLFDEPLSNLDAQLRDEMRSEIKRLHQELGATMIYVTHDQIEAMTLADRIVLMSDGVIEQAGAPLDLFERPATLRRRLPRLAQDELRAGRGAGRDDPRRGRRRRPGAAARAPRRGGRARRPRVRPEHMGRAHGPAPAPGTTRIDATIELLQPTGSRTFATFRLGPTPVLAELPAHDAGSVGETIPIDIHLNRCSLFDRDDGTAL